ncbi:formin-J-like [Nymphalis io]|uniref:formin-J-like n=1 Tax=Inachis io TaxID=171585 RepID=UPI002167414C|nr:formin-J-like [Nymphalis io]
MKHQKENYFKSKFVLLNSQEESQKIIWSCSDSSDYENSHNEINVKAIKRKRKRVKGKKKIYNNISNLDVTYVDVTLDKNNENVQELRDHSNIEYVPNILKVGCTSPILKSQQYLAPLKTKKSTVNCLSPSEHKEKQSTSPVLVLKYNTPKFSPKVRKKLFSNNGNTNHGSCSENRSLSPVLNSIENRLRKYSEYQNKTVNENSNQNKNTCQINIFTQNKEEHKCDSSITKVTHIYKYEEIPLKYQEQQIYNNINLDETLTDKTKKVVLVEKVKSYFDSYFSPTANSQHSISEYESKSSPISNDDIEIISSLPETKCTQSLISDNRSSSDSFKYFDKNPQTAKKVKYKKDGLAYRLSALIKKQNASTSLWYHERFLAANSNFVLPQEQFMALRIQAVSFKCNCFLLKALNVNDENCLILINNLYAKNNIIEENCVLKIYKPYKIIEFEDFKLIINVCKYECVIFKN